MVTEEIRKTFLSGLGMVLLTKEKLQEVGRRLVEDAQLSKEQVETVMDELYRSGEIQWQGFEKAIGQMVRSSLDDLEIPRSGQVQKLQQQVEQLQRRIDILEAVQNRGKSTP